MHRGHHRSPAERRLNSLRLLLWPFSRLYAAAVRLRAWSYRKGIFPQRRLDGVVISVGNLTVGGTGKTPLVLWLAERLAAEGKRTGILIRGYRAARGQSDEVNLLRNRLGDFAKIGVGAHRHLSGRVLARKGVEWFVLDDGFQHLQLARDADIVLLDASEPFEDEQILPAGRLREPKSALERADLLVITRSGHAPAIETIVRRYSAAPIFYAQTELDGILALESERATNLSSEARGKKLFAFCGIGNPSAFFQDLHRWGLRVAGTAAFRDHHHYSQQDAEEIEKRALAAGAEALVCTEKDIFNLSGAKFSPLPVCYCRISLRISEEKRFLQEIMTAVERNKRKVAQ
jgi:tetraacyldisaccharide 4'-kinase